MAKSRAEVELGRRAAGKAERKTLVRSVSLPVVACLSHPWRQYPDAAPGPNFCDLVRAAWRATTDLANWASHELARADVVRTPDLAELPPAPKVDLYAHAFGRAHAKPSRLMFHCPECPRKFFPSKLDPGGRTPDHGRGRPPVPCAGVGRPAVACARTTLPPVEARYGGWEGARIQAQSVFRKVAAARSKYRPAIVWLRRRRSPEYLFPQPYPVHPSAWVPYWDDSENQHRPVVGVALPGGRVTLQLRRRSTHGRNGVDDLRHALEIFGRIVDGELPQHELTITAERLDGPTRHGRTVRIADGSGKSADYQVAVKISYQEEVYESRDPRAAAATTGGAPFLTVVAEGVDRPWLLHAPWVPQWVAEHARFRRRFADDTKYEKRWPARKRRSLGRRQARACGKQNDRLKTFYAQTAAQVVGWVRRQRCGALAWDDSDRTFAESLGWAELRAAVQHECDEWGIALVASGREVDAGVSGQSDVTSADA